MSWLEFSGLELTGRKPEATVTIFKITRTWCPHFYCIKGVETLPTWYTTLSSHLTEMFLSSKTFCDHFCYV